MRGDNAVCETQCLPESVGEWIFRSAIGWIEGIVATESTSACADFAIAVRAAETRIDADFLHAATELLGEISIVAVETAFVTPRKSHVFSHFGSEKLGLLMKFSSVKVLRKAFSCVFLHR